MKQQNKQRYFIRYLSIFAILISIVLLKTSCTKLDVNYQPNQVHPSNFVEQFFATKTTPTPVVANLIQKLKDENQRTGFVNNLPKNCGLPIWEKVVFKKSSNHNDDASLYSPAKHGPSANLTEDSTEVDVIPLSITDSALSSLLVVKDDNGTITTNCITTNDDLYNNLHNSAIDSISKVNNLLWFMFMENQTFGTNIFYHIPATILNNGAIIDAQGNRIIQGIQTQTNTGNFGEICWTFCCGICYGNDPYCPNGGCTTICFDINDDPWPGPGSGGGGGTGTGGPGGPGPGGTGPGGTGGGPCGTCTPPPPPPNCNDPFYSFGPCGPLPPDPVDQYGFLQSRKNFLSNYLAINPFGLQPCDSLNILPLGQFETMYQRISQFLPNQYVRNRVDSIRNVAPNWIVDNFNIQSLDEAFGPTVNCDFFPLRITSFPNGMNQRSFLEYFRTHLNDFITPPEDANFAPYANGNFNDTSKWNSPYESSLGALVHIYINPDNGTVLLSDYQQVNTGITQKNRFKFTTMSSPLDHEHPVAGNREFGIYNTNEFPNEFTFYTMGVDRTWDLWNTLGEFAFNGFQQADNLWLNVQQNVSNYINSTPGGNAAFYSKRAYTARPQWEDVKDFLRGLITFETLKQRLGCP